MTQNKDEKDKPNPEKRPVDPPGPPNPHPRKDRHDNPPPPNREHA